MKFFNKFLAILIFTQKKNNFNVRRDLFENDFSAKFCMKFEVKFPTAHVIYTPRTKKFFPHALRSPIINILN